jgi:hypothetical protein
METVLIFFMIALFGIAVVIVTLLFGLGFIAMRG